MKVTNITRKVDGTWKIRLIADVDEWVSGLHREEGDDHYGEVVGTSHLTITINAREILESAKELPKGQVWNRDESGLMLTSALYTAAKYGYNEWNRHLMNDMALTIDNDSDLYHKVLAIEEAATI